LCFILFQAKFIYPEVYSIGRVNICEDLSDVLDLNSPEIQVILLNIIILYVFYFNNFLMILWCIDIIIQI